MTSLFFDFISVPLAKGVGEEGTEESFSCSQNRSECTTLATKNGSRSDLEQFLACSRTQGLRVVFLSLRTPPPGRRFFFFALTSLPESLPTGEKRKKKFNSHQN
ncbi:hypothetical protein CDAR_398141 [Caerostris darwini]|uniref:Uncharacterized protein n=1 Tax=Caerostris darwini TaxID=1538125 RepID=A0AAV4WTS8_9ARAC|nr:hypothetical protein CDAR_398141 [Caerostris darwini]